MLPEVISIGVTAVYVIGLSLVIMAGLRRLHPTLKQMFIRRRRLTPYHTTVWIMVVTYICFSIHLPFEIVSQILICTTDVNFHFCAIVIFQEQLLDITTCLCYVVIAAQRLNTVIQNRPIPAKKPLWKIMIPVLCLINIPFLLYGTMQQRERFSAGNPSHPETLLIRGPFPSGNNTEVNSTSTLYDVQFAICLRREIEDSAAPYSSFECEFLLIIMASLYLTIPIIVSRKAKKVHAQQQANDAKGGDSSCSSGKRNSIQVLSMSDASRRLSLPASYKFFHLVSADDDPPEDSPGEGDAVEVAVGSSGEEPKMRNKTKNQKYKKPQYRRGTLSLDMTNMALSGKLPVKGFTPTFLAKSNAQGNEEKSEESSNVFQVAPPNAAAKRSKCLELLEEELDCDEDVADRKTSERSESDDGDELMRNLSPEKLCNFGALAFPQLKHNAHNVKFKNELQNMSTTEEGNIRSKDDVDMEENQQDEMSGDESLSENNCRHSLCIVEERQSTTTVSETFNGNSPVRLSFKHSRDTTVTIEIYDAIKASTSETYKSEFNKKDKEENSRSPVNEETSASRYFDANFARGKCGHLPALGYYRGKLLPNVSFPASPCSLRDEDKTQSVRKETTDCSRGKPKTSQEKTTVESNTQDPLNEVINPEYHSTEWYNSGKAQLAGGCPTEDYIPDTISHTTYERDKMSVDKTSPFAKDPSSPKFEICDTAVNNPMSQDSKGRDISRTAGLKYSTVSKTSCGSHNCKTQDSRFPVVEQNNDSPDNPVVCPVTNVRTIISGIDNNAHAHHTAVLVCSGSMEKEELVPPNQPCSIVGQDSVCPQEADPIRRSQLQPKTCGVESNEEQKPAKVQRSHSVHAMPVTATFGRPRPTSLAEVTRRVVLLMAVAMLFILPKALFLQCASLLDVKVASYVYVFVKLFQYASFMAHHYVYVCMLKPLMRLLAS